ncbi:hypothetical protein EOE18_14835 [Novosphingobium umbonatum]|uniref:Transmembrane protein n=1 Tax=Novosphingobium umbonatum TaxID=1908524 RepID=A0A3S2Y4Y3_9SPHN|nr:hypothetical protein [Novosphingobium umbonatum]RVU03595.1 hypothetical protein EOE18_14835 [Novosphingobium umbonatum]
MTALRSHLAAFWAMFWGCPYGKWVSFLVISVFTLFLALYGIIAIFLSIPLLLGFGLTWLVLAVQSLRDSWQEAKSIASYRALWLKGVSIPLLTLATGVALLWPALFLGSRLKTYIVLAAHYVSYERAVAVELAKPHPRQLLWDYDGFLDNTNAIVWDGTGHPAKRLIKEEGADIATCSRLIGDYYDCGIDY